MGDDVTLAVLREIRDETRATRTELSARIDEVRTELSARIDEVRSEVSAVRTELSARIGRVEEVLVDLAEQQRFVVRWLRAGTERDRKLEGDLALLKLRVEALEARVPEPER